MSTAALEPEDYIIGTNDAEVRRLGEQHAIWRESALSCWRRAGLKPGMTVLDLGCGPGYASFDLARLVGPQGQVIAVDQSTHFLAALEAGAGQRGLSNIRTLQADVTSMDWTQLGCDAVWTRWCLSFVPGADGVLAGLDQALQPGGVVMMQEYVDYRSFRIEPAEPVFERFIAAVRDSWVHFGGDPEIGRRLPAMGEALGWSVQALTPIIHAARPGDVLWTWPKAWLQEAPDRLVALGFLTADEATDFRQFLARRDADPASLLMTPMVMEMIARKPQ
ncbi:methyltransferase domain-containing protein [Maricaulis sp.]|uniref:methyltransferase domain-containing protein n=1 Tax=Maricaulis sp. TaxID=1486257 RepID=UPI0025C4C24D|nr:methyltransferase domain-containing protein [Maricaulis sp.]